MNMFKSSNTNKGNATKRSATDWRNRINLDFYHQLPPRQRQGLIAGIIIILLLVIWHRYDVNHKKNRVTPIPVVVAPSMVRDVPVYLSMLGGVTPTYSVTVKTQLNGTLQKVFFREGQMVKANDVLALIDPRPYEAQLVQYEGQLVRDQALLDNAVIDLKRYQTLWKQDSISQQTLATQESLVKQYQGAVLIDKGLIETTKVNLIYTRIIAPVDGRVGLRLVDPGNFVQISDSTGIAVINTLNPITVIFTIPEDDIQDVLQKIYAHEPLEVQAFDRQQNKLLATGSLLTIDNQIDPNTGTVKLRAQFRNDNNALFPSQFVNVRLLTKILHNAVLVPTTAVQYISKNSFVYVLNANKTVSLKPVKVGVTSGENTVILGGVLAGQNVVIEGADKLTDGSPVILATPNNSSRQAT